MSLRARAAAAAALFAAPLAAQAQTAPEPALLPRPATIAMRTGAALTIGPATRIVIPAGDSAAREAASWLRDELADTLKLRLTLATGPARRGDIRFASAAAMAGGDEAYMLDVDAQGVSIQANGGAGLFYGGVTLWQLLTERPGAAGRRLAPLHIADQPRFLWRGLMLDSARHMQSVAFIEHFIDWMALHKLNNFHWHLADDQGWRIEIKRYPKLTSVGAWRQAVFPDPPGRYGGYYTQDQIRAVVAYAARRHVNVMPEIDLPGHSTALIAAYPELGVAGFKAEPVTADWGLLPEVLNTDDYTFETVQNILSEVMDLFPSPYIDLGGDEVDQTQWKASPAVQAKMRALGLTDESALERWFIGRLGKFVEAHGRRIVGWDEIQEGASGDGLDTQAVVMSWHGGEGAAKAARSEHDVIIAQAPLYYLDNRQSTAPDEPPSWTDVIRTEAIYRHDPVPAGLTPAQQAHVLGLQGQLWTERARTEAWAAKLTYPRASAIAEVGWTPAGRLDWDDFSKRLIVQRTRYRLMGLDAGGPPAPPQPATGGRVSSVALDFCVPDTTGLILSPPPGGAIAPPRVKVAMRQPCWVERGVDLGTAKALDLSLVHLPYNERLGAQSPILELPKPRTPEGEIEVHADAIDGPLVASLPLAGFPAEAARHTLTTQLHGGSGRHDLYFVLTGASIDTRILQRPPLTVLEWVQTR
ncbi:family 20 glycosylhydrolase [Sphingomonas oryzagri]|uniref:beta-N-acetylhexosaminidase n=1 Tax=Sphingomonas oryzagri TaxID=3042314 RepID=A0ABT6MZ72_9SPHN|nr:family 20 glycosylhydrolase [Sphingomonas oryzagri]MDH7637774.1 family 20 glycosylhydrolase [Sphingomonas oryzagri]